MKKLVMLAIASVMAVGSAMPAQAKMDCNKDYSDFWKKLMENGGQKLEGAKLAEVQRQGLRGYDACAAGDDSAPGTIWMKLLEDVKGK